MKRMIPVFYHVPKNAGTYVSDWMLIAFRYYRRTYTNWLENHIPEKDSIKCFQILKNGFKIAKLLIGDPLQFCETYPKFITKHSKTEWDINLEDVTQDLLDNVFLFGVIIEAHGFKIKNDILNLLKERDLHKFIILRDSFSRAQSIYYYNISEYSKHDYTHGLIKSKTFEEYILSDELEDSWLIRNLVNVDNSIPINEHHFNKTKDILNEFKISNLKNIDNVIQEIFLSCYDFDTKKIELRPWDVSAKNDTNYKKIKFETLPLKIQEIFKQRTYWDNKLYNTFFDQ